MPPTCVCVFCGVVCVHMWQTPVFVSMCACICACGNSRVSFYIVLSLVKTASHWTWSLLFRVGWLAGSPRICWSLPPWCWGFRCVLPTAGFYVGAQGSELSPYACSACTAHRAVLLAPNGLFVRDWKSLVFGQWPAVITEETIITAAFQFWF